MCDNISQQNIKNHECDECERLIQMWRKVILPHVYINNCGGTNGKSGKLHIRSIEQGPHRGE